MNELEKIIYNMDFIFVNDGYVENIIAQVILKLPLEVKDFIENEILFVNGDKEERASCINLADLRNQGKGEKGYIIYIDAIFHSISEEEKKYIIAHEIGHAYLKHSNVNKTTKNENEANNFAIEHGFSKAKTNSHGSNNKEEVYKKIDSIIKIIAEYKIEPLFSGEVKSREQREPKTLDSDDDFFMAIAVLITYSQNAQSNKVQEIWETDSFIKAFQDFNVEKVANLDPDKIINEHWENIKAIRFKKKVNAIVNCARVINKIAYKKGTFLKFFHQANIPERINNAEELERFWEGFGFLLSEFKKAEMPFFSSTTTLLHLLLDMGYDCVKPDLVLLKFAEEIGIFNKEKFVRLLQEYCLARSIRPSVLDLYLLIYGGQLGVKQFVKPEYYKNVRGV